MSALDEWLTSVGLTAHVDLFAKHDIEMADVFDLSESDLREIGLTVGERKRFVRAVAALRLSRREAAPPLRLEDVTVAGTNPHLMAERRHLTVMFCDIVGSSSLAELMDAEDVLDLMQRYQNFSGAHIERFGGYIAKFLGDGIVAWFGYPSASEWDAESALRAALEIVRAMDTLKLPDGDSLNVRIGIATGHVVIGDLFGSGTAMEQPVAGVTPNLAARIQNLAPVNGIVVSENTWRLTAGRFLFRDTGTHSLRGFSLPVRAWEVLGERAMGDDADPAMLVPLAGRETELALLRDLWRRTREAVGAVVLVQGEPGIGKSRLIEDFLTGIDRHAFCRLGVHASQFNSSNPLFPVISLIERFAGIDRLDSGPERLAKLSSVLAGDEQDREAARRILAPLLSIAGDAPALETPRQLKELTLQTLVRQLCLMSETKSVVVLVEDIHWLDPTTLELLDRLIGCVRNRPIMIIMTSRDPFPQDWIASPGVHAIELPRLPSDGSIAILRSLTAGEPLDPRIEAMIIERTDGIPLFVEELTRTLLEERAQGTMGQPDQIPIPLSLQDLLMARLDRAGPAKELAQTGAVIGRSFDRTLLSAVSDFTTEELENALSVLICADLIHREGQEVYSFKHALVQDAAYRSLLRDQRRSLHAGVAMRLMELTPEVSDLNPDLLAHHLTEAGQTDRAIGWWIKAGRRSLDRSAMQEAERHLSRALTLAETLPEDGTQGKQTDELRMEIMALLGPVLIFLRGPGSAEVERLYARAYEISRRFPETSANFQISWGWWRLSRDFTVMRARADSPSDARLRAERRSPAASGASLPVGQPFQPGRSCGVQSPYRQRAGDLRGRRVPPPRFALRQPRCQGLRARRAGAGAVAVRRSGPRAARGGGLARLGRRAEPYRKPHPCARYRADASVLPAGYRQDHGTSSRHDRLGGGTQLSRPPGQGAAVPWLGAGAAGRGRARAGGVANRSGPPEGNRDQRGFPGLSLHAGGSPGAVRQARGGPGRTDPGARRIRADRLADLGARDGSPDRRDDAPFRRRRRGRRRDGVPERPDRGRPAGCDLPGTACGHQPCPAVGAAGQAGRSVPTASSSARTVLHPCRDARPAGVADADEPAFRAAERKLAGVRTGLAALDEAPKAWLAGTHRTVAPETTLERFLPLASRMGITRLSDVTGLDTLGIPVWMACRPNSRSLAVSQGKGLTHAAAKASAFMELAETWHAESVALPMRYMSRRDLAAQADVVEVDGLPLSRHGAFHPDRPILWVEGRELLTHALVWLPLELVGADFTDPPPAGSGCFAATTNGLASGNSLTEAIAHGLYEIIERDALALWRLKGGPVQTSTRIDPASLTGDAVTSVIERFDSAKLDVGLWDVTSDIGVPVFQCVIAGREAGSGDGGLFDAELGSGCHPDPEVALLRALTEAAQARTTFIAGSRDDFDPDAWTPGTRLSRRQAARQWLDTGVRGGMRDFRSLASHAGPTVRGDLARTVERIAAASAGPVLYADLTRPDLGLPVARVVVPGLEGAFRGGEGDFVPGRRARAVIEAGR